MEYLSLDCCRKCFYFLTFQEYHTLVKSFVAIMRIRLLGWRSCLKPLPLFYETKEIRRPCNSPSHFPKVFGLSPFISTQPLSCVCLQCGFQWGDYVRPTHLISFQWLRLYADAIQFTPNGGVFILVGNDSNVFVYIVYSLCRVGESSCNIWTFFVEILFPLYTYIRRYYAWAWSACKIDGSAYFIGSLSRTFLHRISSDPEIHSCVDC